MSACRTLFTRALNGTGVFAAIPFPLDSRRPSCLGANAAGALCESEHREYIEEIQAAHHLKIRCSAQLVSTTAACLLTR